MNLFINSRIHLIGSLIIILSLVAAGILSAASVNKQAESNSENQDSKNNQENFMLTDHMGSKVSLFDYKGKVVILLFGYTHCPDICPTQLADMQRLLEKMGDKADQVQVLFITFD
ncbi:MAG: SCO family protein, partial [Nitrospinota bacterium]|nr:SCO family protein [Nitrospinota bacterium]